MKNLISLSCCVLALATCALAQKEKISVDELINKHVASIGTPEARAAARSLVMVGQGTLSSKLGYSGRIGGPAQIASADDKFLLAMIFNSSDYPYEKLAFDGKNLSLGRRSSGEITKLGEFIKAQSSIIKQGLFGGVLSSNWPLAHADKTKVKMEYSGIETISGKQLHKLKLRSSGDLRITAYFEVDTFRHVSTVYEYSIGAYSTSSDRTENAHAKASYFSLTEQFSDFKQVGSLTLPMGYSITVTSQTEGENITLTWATTFKQAFFNEPLDASVFKVS